MRRDCRPSSRGSWIARSRPNSSIRCETLAQRVALLGALNSLSQITLKATMPGVPDFYQGTEFWDLSLVDPDNRRPVDFAERAAVLAAVETPDWESLAQNWPDGHLKLAWTRHLLKLRTELADVFTHGDYQPLEVSGPHRDHVIAFARRHGRDAAIIAVAKSFAPLSQGGRAWPRAEGFDGALDLERLFGRRHRQTRTERAALRRCSGICRSRC